MIDSQQAKWHLFFTPGTARDQTSDRKRKCPIYNSATTTVSGTLMKTRFICSTKINGTIIYLLSILFAQCWKNVSKVMLPVGILVIKCICTINVDIVLDEIGLLNNSQERSFNKVHFANFHYAICFQTHTWNKTDR